MSTISLTLPVSGTVITAGLHSTNYTTIQNVINGGIDNNNIAAAAGIDGTKLFGVIRGVRVFTTSGTYTPTSGTNRVYIECVGGGGGGGGSATGAVNQGGGGGGGGGGGYSASFLTANFSGKSYVVGAAGTGATAGNNTGVAGGDTTFDTTVIVAKGGSPGTGSGISGGTGIGGGPGAGGSAGSGTGDTKVSGSGGQFGQIFGPNSQAIGGSGGASVLGGQAATNGVSGGTSTGNAGGQFGGGGAGGSVGGNFAAAAGGAGAAGVIRIWEFA